VLAAAGLVLAFGPAGGPGRWGLAAVAATVLLAGLAAVARAGRAAVPFALVVLAAAVDLLLLVGRGALVA
jgi:hypothetical protein